MVIFMVYFDVTGTVFKLLGVAQRLPVFLATIRGAHVLASEESERTRLSVASGSGVPDFQNFEAAYEGHTWSELLRSYGILRLCRGSRLVDHADRILEMTSRFLGERTTDAILRQTLFRHFCPGSTGREAVDAMYRLSSRGVNAIFDWVPNRDPSAAADSEAFDSAVEKNVKTILQGIDCASTAVGCRMVAVKLATITSTDALKTITDRIGHLRASGSLDSLDWVSRLDRHLFGRRQTSSPLPALDSSTKELWALKQRLQTLTNIASRKRVRLLIDAEETEIQPALDYVVLSAMHAFNASEAWICNTYQCYLKDARERLMRDMEWMLSEGRAFGVKLVRGAYIKHETMRAQRLGCPSPVFHSKQETDASYDRSIQSLFASVRDGDKVEVCLATHNQSSIESALQSMHDLNIDRHNPNIHFAQLYGMKDYLTYGLGRHGYSAAKLLVFGDVHQVIPYLIRRAQENASVIDGAGRDLEAIKAVMKIRMQKSISIG